MISRIRRLLSATSLSGRLIRTSMVWAVPVLLLTALALTWFYRTSSYRLFDEQIESTITSLVAFSQPVTNSDEPLILLRSPSDPRFAQRLSGRYWRVYQQAQTSEWVAFLNSGSISTDSIEIDENIFTKAAAEPGTFINGRAAGPDEQEKLRIIVQALYFDGVETPIIFMAGARSAPADQAILRFTILVVGLMLLLIGGMVLAVYMQVRFGLRPLFHLQNSVAAVREGQATHVDGEFPAEIQPLANELNTLIEHNQTVVAQAKTHVSNLAHALKTPLAVLKNEAAHSSDTLSEIVARQSNIMQQQVDHHLRRARAAARGQSIGVVTQAVSTINSLKRTMLRIHRDKPLDIIVDVPSHLYFRGEKTDLEEIIGNVLDNACKWTRNLVLIKGEKDPKDPTFMFLHIEDDGPGLSADNYAKALKRGERLDEATPGTGFGLSIVADLAQAYKGKIELRGSELGGLGITLRLPCRA